MAKRRVTSESGISGAGAGLARERRKHSVISPAPPASSQELALPPPDAAEIARLAYSYWEARGRQGGSPEQDWLRAERELRHQRATFHAGA
jgi:hypothetical protein